MYAVLTEEALYQKSSQELTALLYEACLDHLDAAIEYIETKEFIDANMKLQKCNDILRRLGVGINYEAGIIADQLDSIYNYMAERLIEANLKKDIAIIKEVQGMLQTIASAWHEAMKTKQPNRNGVKQQVSVYEKSVLTESGK